MASTAVLTSVAQPKQARSQQTLVRLLDSAEQLIEEKGLSEVSIPEIVLRARSSVGGFYARFKDKNELLGALEERFFDDIHRRLERLVDRDRCQDSDLNEVVASCVSELVTVAHDHDKLIAAFILSGIQRASNPDADSWQQFRAQVSEDMTNLILYRRDEIDHPDPALAIDLAVKMAFGLMFQRVISGAFRTADRELEDSEVEIEITRIVVNYLGIRPRSTTTRQTT